MIPIRRMELHVSPLRVSAQDCYELGRIAYNGGDYYHTILWMTQALDLMKNTPSEHDPGMSVTLDYLAYATYVVSSRSILTNFPQICASQELLWPVLVVNLTP